MKQTPILFSTPMVKAILDGSKTMTRRIVKYNKVIDNPEVGFSIFTEKGEFSVRGIHKDGNYGESFFKKPYTKGDILWVRETWAYDGWYKASCVTPEKILWRPSIFMPKEACRIWLEITNVRAERLQDITESDSIREGIEIIGVEPIIKKEDRYYKDYLNPEQGCYSPRDSFHSLWWSINGYESWKANPWVWCISFKRIEKPL